MSNRQFQIIKMKDKIKEKSLLEEIYSNFKSDFDLDFVGTIEGEFYTQEVIEHTIIETKKAERERIKEITEKILNKKIEYFEKPNIEINKAIRYYLAELKEELLKELEEKEE